MNDDDTYVCVIVVNAVTPLLYGVTLPRMTLVKTLPRVDMYR